MKSQKPETTRVSLICEVPETKEKVNYLLLINLDVEGFKKIFPNSPLNLRMEFPSTNDPDEKKKTEEINAMTKKSITEFLQNHPLRECFTYDGEKILPNPKKSTLL